MDLGIKHKTPLNHIVFGLAVRLSGADILKVTQIKPLRKCLTAEQN